LFHCYSCHRYEQWFTGRPVSFGLVDTAADRLKALLDHEDPFVRIKAS
jgi:hypothetical protein